jgi:hypothetical protein
MKYRALFALLAAVSFLSPTQAAAPDNATQSGTLATVRLLATGRPVGGSAPDGMQFLFLVTRAPGVEGPFSLKETRDFTVAGSSYQEKTQAELGQQFQPRTIYEGNAESFFTKQPGLRGMAPDDIAGASILTLVISGTRVPAGAPVEVTMQLGFGKAIEPFKFNVTAPPARPDAPK